MKTSTTRIVRATGLAAVMAAGLVAGLLEAPPAGAADRAATLTVAAGKHDRLDTPVSVELAGLAKLTGPVGLAEVKEGKTTPVPCQLEPGTPPRLWWILSGKTPAGQKRVYQLVGAAPAAQAPRVKIDKADGKLIAVCGGLRVFQYNMQPIAAPQGVNKIHERSAYIHPLWSAGAKGKQRVLTDDFPGDHHHHHGIWFPWTHTTFEGRHVDFWNLGGGQGTVRFVKLLGTTEGRVWGGFRAEHEFVVFQYAQGPKDKKGRPRRGKKTGEKAALKEIWDARVFDLGGAGKGWLWQVTSTQWCATDQPVELPKYRYGGFSYRAAKEWRCDKDSYLTDAGKDGTNSDNTKARWCILSGDIDAQRDSVTMMSHPSNMHHPEPLRTWVGKNKRLFADFASMRHEGWGMKPGTKYVFHYRLHVAEGQTTAAQATRLWNDFAQPPAVSVTR